MANTTKFQKVINAAEAKIETDAASVRDELAKVTEALPALRAQVQDVADARGKEDEFMSRLARGEDVAAIDLVVARAADEIADYRLRTTEGRIAALTNALPAPSRLLADKIAPAVRSVLPGVEVITTTAPLKTWRNEVPEGTTACVVLCVDPKVVRDPFLQYLSGTVRAHYVRTGLHRPVSVANLESAHLNAKPDCAMSVLSNQVGDDSGWVTVAGTTNGNQSDPNALVVDVLTIAVTGVIDGLPILREAKGSNGLVKTWVMHCFAGFQTPGAISTGRVTDMPDLAAGEQFVIRFGMGSTARALHPKVTEDIDGDGVRTLTVRHTLNLNGVEPVSFAEELQGGAQDYVGSSHIDSGVLTSVEAIPRIEGSALTGIRIVDVVCVYKSAIA